MLYLNYVLLFIFLILSLWKIWIYANPGNIGKYGEWRVARKLKRLPKEYVVLNDILLPTNFGTTQIDHIIVSPYGIFIIETKNYKGWILGHQDSEEWSQSLLRRGRHRRWSSEQHKFRNPIRQNLAHSRAVKTILKDIGDFTIIPIVVFADRADLKVTTPNHTVINWCDLISVIESYQIKSITSEAIQLIVSRLSDKNIIDNLSRERHTQHVQNIQQNVEFAVENMRCPKCGGDLIERDGRYGRFLGCSRYPKCKYTHKL